MSTNELKKREETLLGEIDKGQMFLRSSKAILTIDQPKMERIERAYPPGTTPPPDVAKKLDDIRIEVAREKVHMRCELRRIAECEEELDKIRHELLWRKVRDQLASRGEELSGGVLINVRHCLRYIFLQTQYIIVYSPVLCR